MTGRWFRDGVATICLCCRLMRQDGVALGLTSHDRRITVDGLVFEPAAGMAPSAICCSASFEADSMAVEGFLNSARITEADLRAGRWNGATFELFACDWQRPEAGVQMLMRGLIGDVRRLGLDGDGSFTAELLSPLVRLARARRLAVSPTCRAELGDAVCGVDMAGRTRDVRAVAVGADVLEPVPALDSPERFLHGRLRVLTGPLAGLDGRVAAVEGPRVFVSAPFRLADGDALRLRLWEGCDKTFATCRERFGNAAAFDGEPHLPGNDALVRYGVG